STFMSGPWDRFHIKFIPSPYLRPLLAFYLGCEMKWLTAMALRIAVIRRDPKNGQKFPSISALSLRYKLNSVVGGTSSDLYYLLDPWCRCVAVVAPERPDTVTGFRELR